MWQLAEAKNKFSELVERAIAEGPQLVTRHGRDAVVVVSASEYHRLTGRRQGFKEYLCAGESLDGVVLDRDQNPARDAEL